jgi:hypothetical protein
MSGCLVLVIKTISDPDCIVYGWADELIAVKYNPKTVISEKNVVVVYRELAND